MANETKQQINLWMVIAVIAVGYLIWSPKPQPQPVDPVAPTNFDTKLIEGSRVAVKALVESMAADMDAAAKDVAGGLSKTVTEVANANTKRDTDSREVFKKSMAELLKPRIGEGDLRPGQESVFSDVARGFRKAVK